MKICDYIVKPTIVKKNVCVFEFQVIRSFFIFWKKVAYTGTAIVNRDEAISVRRGIIYDNELREWVEKAEDSCKTEAKFIFRSYDLGRQKKQSKYMYNNK